MINKLRIASHCRRGSLAVSQFGALSQTLEPCCKLFCWADRLPICGMVLRLKTGCVRPICSTYSSRQSSRRLPENGELTPVNLSLNATSNQSLFVTKQHQQTSHSFCVVLLETIHQPSCQHVSMSTREMLDKPRCIG